MYRQFMQKLLLVVLGIIFSTAGYCDQTNWSEIRQINYNATADFLFFVTDGPWQGKSNGAITCEPTYVQVSDKTLGKDKILSLGLAAHLAGKKVMFQGTCEAGSNYFNATYIIIK